MNIDSLNSKQNKEYMKKVRYYLTVIALLATLSRFSLQGFEQCLAR